MTESFRERWRSRPVGNTTAGAIVDAVFAEWDEELRNPKIDPGRRNRLEFLMNEVESGNLYPVKGLIDRYHEGFVKVR